MSILSPNLSAELQIEMRPLPIDIWSDVACPWCWVGKRHLETAIAALGVSTRINWRAFELDPTAPREVPEQIDYVDRLARKYGSTRNEAQQMIDRMVDFGRAAGVEMRFDHIRPSSTFDAHRLLAWARARGRQTELKERLFAAYLRDGLCVSDPGLLANLAAEVGLDRDEARLLLPGEDHVEDVRTDEQLASQMGATAVPFFVFDGRLAVSGAQPAEVLREAMTRVVGGLE